MMRRPRVSDRGSATIWVIGCILLLLLVATVGLLRALAVLARHRAESAADLAALAAAARIGTSEPICPAAAQWAALNGADLVGCELDLGADGRSGTVRVRVRAVAALPIVGTRAVVASARAGRLAAPLDSPAMSGRVRPERISGPESAALGVWHAFSRVEPAWDTRAGRERGVVAWSFPCRSRAGVTCPSLP